MRKNLMPCLRIKERKTPTLYFVILRVLLINLNDELQSNNNLELVISKAHLYKTTQLIHKLYI